MDRQDKYNVFLTYFLDNRPYIKSHSSNSDFNIEVLVAEVGSKEQARQIINDIDLQVGVSFKHQKVLFGDMVHREYTFKRVLHGTSPKIILVEEAEFFEANNKLFSQNGLTPLNVGNIMGERIGFRIVRQKEVA